MKHRFVVQRATFADVAPLIQQFHYSGNVPKGKNVYFRGNAFGDVLYAASVYGWGVNPYQETFLTKLLERPVERANCYELKRLARSEPAWPEYPLTSFLAGTHRLLRQDGIRYIIAFSDPGEGHSGGIYRAANFVHVGTTQKEMHCVNADGEPVHRRVAYRHARAHGITIQEARDILGLTTIETQRKDRWLLDLEMDLRRNPPKPINVG